MVVCLALASSTPSLRRAFWLLCKATGLSRAIEDLAIRVKERETAAIAAGALREWRLFLGVSLYWQ